MRRGIAARGKAADDVAARFRQSLSAVFGKSATGRRRMTGADDGHAGVPERFEIALAVEREGNVGSAGAVDGAKHFLRVVVASVGENADPAAGGFFHDAVGGVQPLPHGFRRDVFYSCDDFFRNARRDKCTKCLVGRNVVF